MPIKYVLFRREARHGEVVRSLKPLPNKVNVNMQRLPLFGAGYLAGEYPGGTTTVEGIPQPAEVRAIWRGPAGHPADGAVCGTAQSGISGTWIITDLNENLRYDVVGRKEGFNDVIVAGVTPTSMVDITYAGAVVENETFTGADGYIEVVGGFPPYSVAAETPLPSGLLPVMDGRKLIIDGFTEDDEVATFDVKVTSSNGAEKIIPLELVVGFKAPQNFAAEVILDNDVFSVALTWEVTNSTQQVKVYRSETPFDLDDMPEPIATLSGTSTTYTDDDVIEDDYFYYMVAAVCEQYELRSNAIAANVAVVDPHWDKVVALLHFDGDFTDESGLGTYTKMATGDVSFSSEGYFGDCVAFGTGTASNVTTDNLSAWNFGNQDFTIEMYLHLTKPLANSESLMGIYSGGNTASTFLWAYTTRGGLLFDFRAGNTYIPGPRYTGAIPVGEWVHLAVTRAGSVFRMFLHGVLVGISTSTATLNYPGTPLKIGGGVNSNVYTSFQGRMDDLRVTIGVARYTENFTPPTEPFPNK